MRPGLAARLALVLGVALPIWPAHGMQFEPVPTASNGTVISGRGPIIKGDAARLEQALGAIPASSKLSALALDSPGGNVAEAEELGRLISEHHVPVVIPSGSQCVSACFLLLASSPRRFAAPDALVGVHSASENGSETDASLAVTTLMARDAADMGVPPAIIGKMVQTTPGRVAWLTHEDLASMNVALLGDEARPAGASATQSGVPATTPVPLHTGTEVAPAMAGRDDRRRGRKGRSPRVECLAVGIARAIPRRRGLRSKPDRPATARFVLRCERRQSRRLHARLRDRAPTSRTHGRQDRREFGLRERLEWSRST